MIFRDFVWWALRKVDIQWWLVTIVQSIMYRNAQSPVRVKWIFGDDFLFKIE